MKNPVVLRMTVDDPETLFTSMLYFPVESVARATLNLTGTSVAVTVISRDTITMISFQK